MCGIAGWFEQRPSGGNAPLARMLDAMIPRGPDDDGQAQILPHAGGRWLLGARRLAILDLSPAGHQPMHDPETHNWLAYNGEVYNFRELRADLEARGCSFRSRCDTEVLLLGYRVWGEAVLQRLRGMFAFALWDDARQTLLLVRDRLGIKPLYYYAEASAFLFASEVRALLASGLVPREMDPTGFDSLLKFGAVQEPATLVRGVKLLPAGSVLRCKDGRVTCESYWHLPGHANGNDASRSRAESTGEIGQILSEAVRMRLVSDVPVGVFLSAGLDSTAVASLAARHCNNLKTFTVTFAEKKYAEGEQARQMASRIGATHAELTLSENDLMAGLPQALAAMDQPTVDGINTYFVARATKQAGVTVALSGLGGDELFAGYRSFRTVPRMEEFRARVPHWAQHMAASMFDSRFLPGGRNIKLAAWLRGADGFPHPFYVSRLLLTPAQVAGMLQPDWLLGVEFATWHEEWQRVERALASHDPVNCVSLLELSHYLRNTLLRDTDCMSMSHSLEVRVPLIDHVLVEQVLRLPGAWKLDGGIQKPLLIAALGGTLPDEIARRAKRGFEFPWSMWLRGRLRRQVEEALAEPGPVLSGALHWDRVKDLWQGFLRSEVHWSRPWLFYVLRNWTQRHLEA